MVYFTSKECSSCLLWEYCEKKKEENNPVVLYLEAAFHWKGLGIFYPLAFTKRKFISDL